MRICRANFRATLDAEANAINCNGCNHSLIIPSHADKYSIKPQFTGDDYRYKSVWSWMEVSVLNTRLLSFPTTQFRWLSPRSFGLSGRATDNRKAENPCPQSAVGDMRVLNSSQLPPRKFLDKYPLHELSLGRVKTKTFHNPWLAEVQWDLRF